MADIKLFRVSADTVQMIPGNSVQVEKSLQMLIERHLETFLGVRFLASEYSTTKSHGGRIDTLGIDENHCPVIIEYKRALNENVINQGLFYLNWLMDHQAHFKLLALEQLGHDAANRIDWRYPRLICIAGDFTKYDEHAIQQIPQNIDLIRYRRYGDELILLEHVARNSIVPLTHAGKSESSKIAMNETTEANSDALPSVMRRFNDSSPEVQDWFHSLRAFILSLGDDIEERVVDSYIAFRRLKNFAFINFVPTKNRLHVDLPLPPDTVTIENGFTRATKWNSVLIEVDGAEDVDRAQALILRSYQET